jgi:hypothetical protein
MAKHKFNRVNAKEAIAIADMIRKHADITTKGARSIVKYHEGWSDARVAEDVGKLLSFNPKLTAIMRVRQSAIGYIEAVANFGNKGPFTERLANIETQLASMQRQVDNLLAQVAKAGGVAANGQHSALDYAPPSARAQVDADGTVRYFPVDPNI